MLANYLVNRFSSRLVFAFAALAFILTPLLCGLAPDPLSLVFARFMHGFAGGMLVICSIAFSLRVCKH